MADEKPGTPVNQNTQSSDPDFIFGAPSQKNKIEAWEGEGDANLLSDSGEMSLANLHFGTRPEADLLKSETELEETDAVTPKTDGEVPEGAVFVQIEENVEGAFIGALSSAAPQAGTELNYEISDERFEVVDGALRLAEGVSLDFETASSVEVTVTTTSGDSAPVEDLFVIDLIDVNDAPMDLALDGNSVLENDAGAFIGTLSSFDPDAGDTTIYTVSDDRFEIVDGALRLVDGVSLDHEAADTIEIAVTATDSGGLSTTETFEISVGDVNEGPVELELDGSVIAENEAGAVVGTLSSFDPDAGDTISYTVSDERFEVVDGELRLADGVSLDHETVDSLEITVTATDSGGLSTQETFTVDVADLNEGPSDLSLDGTTVAENASGAVVGTLSSFDPDAGDTATYTVSDERFEVVDGELRLAEGVSLDHETAETLDVTVTVTDSGGLSSEETFTITVEDVNEGPSDLALDGSTVAENDAGAVVGTLSSFDPDAGDTATYTVSDPRFEVVDGELRLVDGESLDHETAESLEVTVTVTDRGGLSTEETFSINVEDVNEGPSDLALDGSTVAENDAGAVIGTLSSYDPDEGATVTYTVSDPRFEVVDGELRLADGESLDHEAVENLDITVTATDSGGLSTEETFTIDVTDINEGPTDLSLDNQSVAENQAGATVGTLSSFDPDEGDTVTYDVSDARFEVVDGELRLADGVSLDHEEAESIEVEVTATDAGGLSTSETFSIDVADVNEAPVDLTLTRESGMAESDFSAEDGFSGQSLERMGLETDAIVFTMSFTTADDVASTQTLFETGGSVYGTNVVIEDGMLNIYAGEGNDLELSVPIDGDTSYNFALELDTENDTIRVLMSDTVPMDEMNADNSLVASMDDWTDRDYTGSNAMGVGQEAGGSSQGRTGGDFLGEIDGPGLQVFSDSNLEDVFIEASVDENTEGAVVGTLSAYDPDDGDSLTYEVSDDRFEVVDGELRLADGVTLDFEEASEIDVTVTATDTGGLSTSETFTVDVADLNEAPTDLSLDNNSIDENTTEGIVGTVSVTDPDVGDTHTFRLVDAEDLPFAIDVQTGDVSLVTPGMPEGSVLHLDASDADSMTLDGGVSAIQDLSGEGNTVQQTDAGERPDLVSDGPFGGPGLQFDGVNDRLDIADDQTLNMSNQTERSFAMTIQTGDDVDGRQVIFEEGGTVNGFNFYIDDGQLYMGAWSDSTGWGFEAISVDVEPNEDYSIVTVYDGASGTYTAYVNGENVGSVEVGDTMSAHSGNIGLGGIAQHTVFHDGASGANEGFYFEGSIGEFAMFNDALSAADASGIDMDFRGIDPEIDFESQDSYELTVEVTDSGGETYQETLTINVNDLNEGPTDLALDSTSVAENDPGAVVGTLSSFDPDADDSVTYTVDDARFEIVDGQVKLVDGESLDHETAESLELTVTATDSEGLSTEETFTIDVADVNEGPSDLALDGTSVSENDSGATVGTLSSFDPDDGDSVTYEVSDPRFEVVDGELKLVDGESLDHEIAESLNITVTATDSEGLSTEEAFTIDVADVNEAPTNLALDGNTVTENDAGAVIGSLSSFDADEGDSVTYDVSDVRFEIVDGELKLIDGESLDHETAESLEVTVTATDADGLSTEETFTINVSDVNEGPRDLALDGDTVAENDAGTVVGTLSSFDPDEGDSTTYTVSDDRFEVVDGELKLVDGESLNHEEAATLEIEVTATDGAGLTTSETFTVNVADVNEAPSDVELTAAPDAFLEQDGLLVIEAENYDSASAGSGGHAWGESDSDGMVHVDDGSNAYDMWRSESSVEQDSPELTYTIHIETPGTYYVHIKGDAEDGPSGNSDSVHIGIDGDRITDDGGLTGFGRGDDWGNTDTYTGNVVAITFDEAGTHELNLWAREDGVSVDQIVLTQDENFNPATETLTESPRASDMGIVENETGATVGTLSSFDPDEGDSVTYTVSDDRFEVVDGELKLVDGESLDHEEASSIEVVVTATDSGGLSTEESFTIDVVDVNEAPTDLALDNSSVAENAAGAVVGSLSAFDPEDGDSITYTVDDARFEVVDGDLRLVDGESLDHESVDSLEVTVTATDSDGLSTQETFTIDVTDVNEAPTNIELGSPSGTLSLNQDGGTDDNAISANMTDFPTDAITVEVSFTADAMPQGSGAPLFSYSAGGNGGNDVLLWAETSSGDLNIFLDGQRIRTDISNADLFDGEEHTVSMTWDQDSGEMTVYVDGAPEYTTTISIDGINSNGTVTLGQEQDRPGGNYDSGQVFQGEIGEVRIYDEALSEEQVASNAEGDVTENGLVTQWVMDEAEGGVVQDVMGNNDLVLENGAEIVELDDGAPTVLENASGATVGTLSSFDPDDGDSVTYSVSDDRFEVVDGELKLVDGESLDHEDADSIEVTVTATDSAGLSSEESFTIDVADVNEAPSDIVFTSAGENLILGGSFEGQDVRTGGWRGFADDPTGNWDSANGIEVWDNLWGTEAADGNQFLELDYGNAADAISQTVNTEAGQSYTLTFDMKARDASTSDTIEVYWNGELVDTFDPGSTTWETVSFDVVGTGSGDVLEFREAAGESDGLGAHLDNISLVEVPFTLVEQDEGAIVGHVSAFDPDAGDNVSLSVSDDRFEIVETADGTLLKLKDGVSVDYETETSIDVTVTATDESGQSISETLTVNVNDLNDTPETVIEQTVETQAAVVENGEITTGNGGGEQTSIVTLGDAVAGSEEITIDFARIDNSFEIEVNGQSLTDDIIQLQENVYNDDSEIMLVFEDGSAATSPWVPNPDGSPRFQVVVSEDGVEILGTRSPGSTEMEPMTLEGGDFNAIDLQSGENTVTVINPDGSGPDGLEASVSGGFDTVVESMTVTGTDYDDTITGGSGDDVLIGGDGDDLFIFDGDSGSDTVDGGAGWTDTIDVSNALSADAEYGDDWTVTLTEGEIVAENADSLELTDDAAGFITLDNGETIDFSNIEQIGF